MLHPPLHLAYLRVVGPPVQVLGNSKKLKTPINTEHIIFIDIDEENRILGSQARAKCWTDTALGPPIAKMLCITVRHAG